MNCLSAEGVEGGDRDPVSGDGAGEDDDQVTDGGVVQDLVGAGSILGRVADGLQNGGVVERKAVD